jgi:hypothetical protein
LLFTAFHQPSIFVTRFFFFLMAVTEEVSVDLIELPDDCRGLSKMLVRFWFGDRRGSIVDKLDRIDKLLLRS